MKQGGLGMLTFIGLALVALLLAGCTVGANDDPFSVKIVNDTPHTVVDHAWFVNRPGTSDGGGPVVLEPGHFFDESEFANEGVGQDRISTPTGKTLGCLPFQFSENPPTTIIVHIAEMKPCGKWGDFKQSKHDWPDPNF